MANDTLQRFSLSRSPGRPTINRGAPRALLLFVFLQSLFAITSTGRLHVTDEINALHQTRGQVETGVMSVPETSQGRAFYGELDREGRPRAPNGPLHALALAPFYLTGKALSHAPGVNAKNRDEVIAFAVVLSSATFAALAGALLFAWLKQRGWRPGVSLGATLACALGTPLFAYSGWLFTEPLTTCLLLGAAWAAFGNDRPVGLDDALLAGLLLGACLLARPGHAIVVPIFALAVIVRDGRRGVAAASLLGLGAAVGLAIYLMWNHHLYGNPFDFGYPETADEGKRLNGFATPLWRGVCGFLFTPGKSIFIFAPVILAALIGLPGLWRRDRGMAALAAGGPLVYLLFYARYTQWEGGNCYGPRYLLPVIALLMPALASFLEAAARVERRLAIALTLAGMTVQAIGLATNFLEDQSANGYYAPVLNYRMSYSPLISQSKLLWRYCAEATRGESAAPGYGFDRWFIYLRRSGVAWQLLAILLGGSMITFAATGLQLWRFSNYDQGARPMSRSKSSKRGSERNGSYAG